MAKKFRHDPGGLYAHTIGTLIWLGIFATIGLIIAAIIL